MLSDLPPPAICQARQEQSAESALAEAHAARLTGQHERARCAAERALATDPQNADAWVELGLIHAAAGDRDAARAAFRQALDIAPRYDDAKLGLARIEYWSGNRDQARTWLAAIDPAHQSWPEAVELRRSLDAQQPEGRTWRLDAFAAYSALSNGLDPWREQALTLSTRTESHTLSVGVSQAERFGQSDVYGEVSLALPTSNATWALTLGGAAKPAFKPEASIGLSYATFEDADWSFGADIVIARYGVGEVDRLGLNASRRLNQALRANGRVIVVRDETDEVRTGYQIGANWTLSERIDASLAWTDAPESSEGVTVDVRSVGLFIGARITPTIRLRGGVLREERDAFDRVETSLALTKAF